MRFKMLDTEIFVSLGFCAVITVMLCFDKAGLAVFSLTAVFFHELSHLSAMKSLGCAPKEIRLTPCSVSIIRDFRVSTKNEVFIALAGPFANFVLGGLSLALFLFWGNERALIFAVINLAFFLFNMLPASSLDGGTVLLALLCKRLENPFKAQRILNIITIILSAFFLFFGAFLLLRGVFNPTMLIVGLYFLVCALMSR